MDTMPKKAIPFLLMALCCCLQVPAQSLLSAEFPAGLPISPSTGPSLGLAGSGTGVQNDFYGMADNPGNLGGITRAVFSSFLSLDYLSINDNNKTAGNLGLSPQLLSFAFPLGIAGTFGFSLDRRTNMNYKFRTRSTIDLQGSGYNALDTIDLGLVNTGGITVWQAGWGYAVGQFVKIGVSYERLYLSGSDFTMVRSAFTTIEADEWDTTSLVFRGNGFRGGVLFPFKKLTVGFSGQYVFSGDIDKVTHGMHYAAPITEKGSFHLPPSFTAGASYRLSTQWLAAASLGVTLWQDYYSSFKLGLPVDNALSVSMGGQYIPAPNLLVPRYWEIMQYRAGLRYTQLPVPTASEMALTLSLGLPIQQGGGLFDVVVEMGRRSDSDIKNYSENFVKIGLGINGGRKWAQSTGIRY